MAYLQYSTILTRTEQYQQNRLKHFTEGHGRLGRAVSNVFISHALFRYTQIDHKHTHMCPSYLSIAVFHLENCFNFEHQLMHKIDQRCAPLQVWCERHNQLTRALLDFLFFKGGGSRPPQQNRRETLMHFSPLGLSEFTHHTVAYHKLH